MAIAAHLHVLLRRKIGRVTDTEWLATNAEYAHEIIRLARQTAREEEAPELADWALKMEAALREEAVPPPPKRTLTELLRGAEEAVPDAPRYVGGIR